jgi:uncharacterized protein (TIGR03000 family)
MRYGVLVVLGALLTWPADASASCFGRRCYGGGCYGGSCYGGGCYGGGWGGRCSGCYGGRYYTGCYGGGYGTGCYSSCAGGHYHQPYGVPRQQLPAPGARSSNYYDPNGGMGRTVNIEVIVSDPSARIAIQGVTTSSTGTVRRFESPMLEEGQNYVYTVMVTRDNQPNDTRQISVRPGDRITVDFTKAAIERPMPVKPPEEVKRTNEVGTDQEKRKDELITPKSDLPK